jgi:hypothetical protein
MFEPDIHRSLMAELEWISAELQSDLNPPGTAPQQLFHRTDAAGLQALVTDQALPALHSRLGWADAVTGYGIDLVHAFLEFRAATSQTRASADFCAALRVNFQPRGSYFDCFLARLFETADGLDRQGEPGPGYALALSTGQMALRAEQRHEGATVLLQQAIYSRRQQLGIIGRLYATYESFYTRTLRRYRIAGHDTLLAPCWDMFRRDIAEFLPRFRCPSRQHEREWLAIALTGPDQDEDGVVFDVFDNRLVPAVKMDISRPGRNGHRALPLHSLVIGAALPYEITREALQVFLSRNKAPFVAINPSGAPRA